MNSEKDISLKLNSGEYNVKLEETLSNIIKDLKSATTEATVASIFETNLYHFVKVFFEKDIVFHKEVGQNHFRHSFNGRLDAISNGLVIEYKAKDKLETEKDKAKAEKQLADYLKQINKETGSSYQGLLTNGNKVKYFSFVGEEVVSTPYKSFEERDLDRVVRSLLEVGSKQFTPQNIVNDFKLDASSSITLNLARKLFTTLDKCMTSKTSMLMEEWQVLFRLSEADRGQNLDIQKRRKALSKIFEKTIESNQLEYKSLYVLQTVYAIIVKLMACKVITKLSYNKDIQIFSDLSIVTEEQLQEFMEKLEDGYVFSSGGVRNLLEGDFYSWYSDHNQWNSEIYNALIEVILELQNYSNANFSYEFSTIDIFKDLYMEIMPNEVRHSLGEYFTPAWLADNVVQKAICKLPSKQQQNWSAIDPCCGSGIFVVSLIKHILRKYNVYNLSTTEKNTLLHNILKRVKGIDINPLSVLTARVSYFLAIFPLLDGQKIEIPVYLGDSADIPRKKLVNDIECYEYTVETRQGNLEVLFPCSFVESNGFFEKLYRLQTTVKAEDSDILFTQLTEGIGASNLNDNIKNSLLVLSKKLVQLHKNEWDGIWIRIISNFMMIARIQDIDIIVGNPPWVKWEYLPQNYAKKIKALCVDKKLFSGQSYMGAISLNLCALIANVTVDNWLTSDGVLAFLMPKTIMTQDSYAGFRNFFLSDDTRMYLSDVEDWSKAGNPFIITQEKFLTYYYQREKIDYFNGIPITNYIKKKGVPISKINYSSSFEQVRDRFDVVEGMAFQLSQDRTGFTMIPERNFEMLVKLKQISGESDYKARSGVEFTPAEVYFVEPTRKGSEKDTYFFKNMEFNNSIYKTDSDYEHELGVNFILPVIKAPTIEPFNIVNNKNYCIFPYKQGKRKSVEIDEMFKENELLANYLIDNRELISRQSNRSRMIAMGNQFYSLSKVGEYTFSPNKVVFRDNTKMSACVVSDVITPWNDKVKPIPAKHSPYISKDNKGNDITEEEAHYLCGILNTEVVRKYFAYTFSGRSYSINFKIKLPKYNSNNPTMKRIAELSKQISKDNKLYKKFIPLIEEQYLLLCQNY